MARPAMIHARIRPATLLLAALVAACDTPTDTDPGERLLFAGVAVTGQLEGPADSLVYVVEDSLARPWRLQVLATGAAPDTVIASLVDLTSEHTLTTVASGGGDPAPRISEWVVPHRGGRYAVVVTGGGTTDGGPFRLLLQPLGPGPETVGRQLRAGDTVATERLDLTGDVDEFSLAGVEGDVIVFLQSPGPDLVWLQVVDSATGAEIRQTTSEGGAADLELSSTGVFRTNAEPGLVRLRHGTFQEVPPGGLPYRLQLRSVAREPEAAAAAIEPGDTTMLEAIDHVGDIDEFGFTATAGQEVVVFAQLERPISPGVEIALLKGESVLASLVAGGSFPTFDSITTGRTALPTDTVYTVRVTGPPVGPPPEATGSYLVEVYGVDSRPEHVPTAVEPDMPVTGEAVDRPGDVDDFHFAGGAGDEVNLPFATFDRALHLLVFDPAGTVIGRAVTPPWGGPFDLPVAGSGTTDRLLLPVTGDYRVRVESHPAAPLEAGSYEFRVHRIVREPETAAASLAQGDTARGESIEPVGDIDTFQFDGQAGQYLNGVLRYLPGASGDFEMAVRHEGSAEPFGRAMDVDPSPDAFATGTFALPETGRYELLVIGSMGVSTSTGSGPYELVLFAIDPAPEVAPVTVAPGDTVRGESIMPVGDFDEYTLSATAGDDLLISFTAPGRIIGTRLEIRDPAGAFVFGLVDNGGEASAGTFRVPATADYRVRVAATTSATTEVGDYEFSVTPR